MSHHPQPSSLSSRCRRPHTLLLPTLLAASSADLPSSTPSKPRLSFEAARWVSFAAMFAGYGAFYLTRNSLAFTAPFMLEDKALGLDLKVCVCVCVCVCI